MKWTRTLQRRGWISHETGENIDPFAQLGSMVTGAAAKARVTYTMGTSREYGEVKCGCTVAIDCPQNEPSIDLAGELAYRKALELTNDGASQLEIPRLPDFVEP